MTILSLTGNGQTQAWSDQTGAEYGTTGVALVLFQADSSTLQSMMRYLSFLAESGNSTGLGSIP
jgi:hypothetical protein